MKNHSLSIHKANSQELITSTQRQLCALTTSHLQGAVFLLQLCQSFSELLPSLFLQSGACERRHDQGEYIFRFKHRRTDRWREEKSCRQTGKQATMETDGQTDRQVGRQTTMLSIISPGLSLNESLWTLADFTCETQEKSHNCKCFFPNDSL